MARIRQGGGNTMRFEGFGCERRMSRDKIGVASWCSGAGGPEEIAALGATLHSLKEILSDINER